MTADKHGSGRRPSVLNSLGLLPDPCSSAFIRGSLLFCFLFLSVARRRGIGYTGAHRPLPPRCRPAMLTLHSGSATRDCAGLTRRNFLRAGSLAIGGLTLPWLLETRARAAAVDPAWV